MSCVQDTHTQHKQINKQSTNQASNNEEEKNKTASRQKIKNIKNK